MSSKNIQYGDEQSYSGSSRQTVTPVLTVLVNAESTKQHSLLTLIWFFNCSVSCRNASKSLLMFELGQDWI